MGSAQYELYAIRFGTKVRRRAETFYRFGIYGEPDEALRIDFYTWLAVGTSDVVAIDTGCNASVARAWGIEGFVDPAEAMLAIGVDSDRIDHVVVSHLHYDHAGNVLSYPNAAVHVAEAEVGFWTGHHLSHPQFSSLVELADILNIVRLNHAGRVRFAEHNANVLPGIRTYQAPGHTPGQLAVVVDTADGPYVVASDAVHYYDELRKLRPFSTFTAITTMLDSYHRLISLVDGDLKRIIPGHDPELRDNCGSADSRHAEIYRVALT
jgi:glyoxylase-like metal-dependent hydrolase (beta-lactamase superfamily II)